MTLILLRPWWLLALIPLGWLLWSLWRHHGPQRLSSHWVNLVDPHLLPYLLVGPPVRAVHRFPLILLGLGWLILVLALAGPAWRQLPQPVYSLASHTLILVDLSPSMNAADVASSRLARARFETLDLLQTMGEGQVGLIAFGPEPFLVSPLTSDAKTIAHQVPLLAPELIPVPGPRRTDWALAQARAVLERSGKGPAQVILITDGVGNLAEALEESRRLAAAGHRLAVLGVGTVEGAPVPLASGGFEQEADGRMRLAPLERAALRELARAGHGVYRESVPDDTDTQALLAAAPRLDQARLDEALKADQWHEEGPLFILALLPLAALAFRRGWLVSWGRGEGRLPLMSFLLLGAFVWPGRSAALEWTALWLRPEQQAARDLAAGRTSDAASFTDPYWRASALYRAGDLEGALAALEGLQGAEVDYNRGVALARLGRFAEAAASFASVLKQAPDHADARHNLEVVRRLIDQSSLQTAPSARQGAASANPSASPRGAAGQGAGPDALGGRVRNAYPTTAIPKVAAEEATSALDERAQSLELRLRAVPDDPAGLLRQRFLLQHLRRKEEGR